MAKHKQKQIKESVKTDYKQIDKSWLFKPGQSGNPKEDGKKQSQT